ncbi:hypothetical protein FB561_2198 [Kribbella amoyensis]|uniref:Nucleotidyltransferase-like protein n=1 Tax=Kribbella amoyensis TaxID=996641 RepID=A0A561BQI0_9ACTN|nr:nucleotidyltransferase domain-containing protein [Kribbella amoyensis]TWD81094.1 hypothetical protein FB561_2198 [Kribbella amoyensis]
MIDDPREAARALAAEVFPTAHWVVLGGSVLTNARTAGSDLDVVVLLPDGSDGVPRRESRRFAGWAVELFVHDAASLDHYLGKDLPGRRPALHRMVGLGESVAGDATAYQARCREVLAAGPDPLTTDELDTLRYGLTDLLDDLDHAPDDERSVIGALLWLRVAEATLLIRRHWVGSGKWLLRELDDCDPAFAKDWLGRQGDMTAVAELARRVLASTGGPLFAGYQLAGERPDT